MIIPVFSISSAHNALGLWHDENYALHQLGRDLAPDYASSILKRWFFALVHAGSLVPKPNHRYDYEGDHRDFVLEIIKVDVYYEYTLSMRKKLYAPVPGYRRQRDQTHRLDQPHAR